MSDETNLKICKAKFSSSLNWWDKMDPYVKFKYCGVKYRTKTREGEDIRPVWNQIITFNYDITEPNIRIRVNDDQDEEDNEIGICTLPLNDVRFPYNEEVKLPLERDGAEAGYLIVEFLKPEEVEEKVDYTDNSGKISKMEREEEEQGINPNSAEYAGYQPGCVFVQDPRMQSMLAMQQQQMLQHQMMMMQMQQGGGYNPMMMNMNQMAMQQQLMANPMYQQNPQMQMLGQGQFDPQEYKRQKKRTTRRAQGRKSSGSEDQDVSSSGGSGSEDAKKKRRKKRKKDRKRKDRKKRSDSSSSSSSSSSSGSEKSEKKSKWRKLKMIDFDSAGQHTEHYRQKYIDQCIKKLSKLYLKFELKDQGWGNQKSRIILALCDGSSDNWEINEYEEFIQSNLVASWTSDIAPHEWQKYEVDLSDHRVATEFLEGMHYELWYIAGGGGGHHIFVRKIVMKYKD